MKIGPFSNKKLSDYSLIAMDMDGTVLNSQGQISNTTINILNSEELKNMTIMFATGRMPKAVINILSQLKISKIVISHNGALISNLDTGEILFSRFVMELAIEKAIQIHNSRGITLHLNGVENVFVDRITNQTQKYERDLDIHVTVVKDLMTVSKNIVSFLFLGEKEILENVKSDLLKQFPNVNYVFIPDNDNMWMLQILGENISKGGSLISFAESKEIPKSKIISFGDNFNDVEMIKESGLGIAMANAQPEILNIADAITLSNDDNGIVYALNKLFDNNRR